MTRGYGARSRARPKLTFCSNRKTWFCDFHTQKGVGVCVADGVMSRKQPGTLGKKDNSNKTNSKKRKGRDRKEAGV